MNLTKTNITNIGDPFVLLYGGNYYLYATSSQCGFCVWVGKTLNELSLAGLCYDAKQSFGSDNFWAPEVVARNDGKFVMHFTARSETAGGQRTGVAVSDSPLGPFADVVRGKPMFDFGYATIDATCFTDDDGNSYLYYVKDCWDNVVDGVHTSQIWGAQLDETLTQVVSEPVLIATPSLEWESKSYPAPCVAALDDWLQKPQRASFVWNEAPFVVKHNGKYYLTYSANCFDSRYYGVGVAISCSPLGNFVKKERPLLQINDGQTCGVGHNMFLQDVDGVKMIMHCHTDYACPSGNRRFCYCNVLFDDDGICVL